MITLKIPGEARPQGSKRPIKLKNGRVVLIENNHNALRNWRTLIATLAAEAMAGKPMFEGPVSLNVVFSFGRPKYHFNSKGELKPNAPNFKYTTPDTDKLIRAAGDALTGICFANDSQISFITALKIYGDKPETEINVAQLSNDFLDHNDERDSNVQG